MKLNIMTFNVQHFRNFNYPEENRVEMDFFADYVKSCVPDILGLNEVFNSGKDARLQRQAYVLAEKAGFEHAYFAEAVKLNGDASYGNAMVSRYPFVAETLIIPDPLEDELNGEYAETRCVLKADYVIDGKKLTVLVTHFGLNDAEMRNAVQTVLNIANNCEHPIILMGDFNCAPDSAVIQQLRTVFYDTADLKSDDKLWTFPSHAPKEKIDYIMTKGDLMVTSLKVNKDVVADHFSMQVEVEL